MGRFAKDVIVTALALALLKLIAFILKAVGVFEIERFWGQTVLPYAKAHGPAWFSAMLELLGGFWGGAIVALLVLASVAIVTRRWGEGSQGHEITARSEHNDIISDRAIFNRLGLYVGDMTISGDDFETSHSFEISIRGFNASCVRLAIPSVNGNIEYVTKEGSQVTATGSLLGPAILRDKTNTWEIANNTEFNVYLVQPLDPNAVDRIANCLKNNGMVFFELNKLDILAAPSDDHSNSARLPIWDGITFRKSVTRYVSGRIFSIKADVHTFSMKASNPDAQS